jgi:hypothetical protein
MRDYHIGQIEATNLPIITAEHEPGSRVKLAYLFQPGIMKPFLLTIDPVERSGSEAEAEQLALFGGWNRHKVRVFSVQASLVVIPVMRQLSASVKPSSLVQPKWPEL